ncbi:MAG: hypothetical protein M3Z32_08065 [Acidobacteriota bacterium]|nr:hypothetical protein [Acidobacteriota bacterium]
MPVGSIAGESLCSRNCARIPTKLVAAGLKHGMGTERALGEGGVPVAVAAQEKRAMDMSMMPVKNAGVKAADAKPVPMAATNMNDMPGINVMAGMNDMKMPAAVRATVAQIIAVALLTLVALGAGVLLALLYGDVSMRPGAAMQMTTRAA